MNSMFKEKYFNKDKENRKPYRGAKAVDKSCHNHGSDNWSIQDRLYQSLKNIERTDHDLKDLRNYTNAN